MVNLKILRQQNQHIMTISSRPRVIYSMLFFLFLSFQGMAQTSNLIGAIRSHNKEEVKRLVNQGVDVNDRPRRSTSTPLSVAIETDQIEIVKLLIENGAKKDDSDLKVAVRNGNFPMTKCLLSLNYRISSAIVNATEANNMQMVKLLVENGADVNISQKRKDCLLCAKYYYTPIKMSVKNGNLEMTDLLINHGVPVKRAISTCLDYDKNDMLKIILKKHKFDHQQLLFLAASSGNLEIVKLAIQKGADYKAINAYGKNLLLIGADHSNLSIVQYAISELKMNPLTKSSSNENALMLASEGKNVTLISYLLDQGININEKDNKGRTAIFHSLENRNQEAFYFLKDKNADLTVVDASGNTLLNYAAKNKRSDICTWLLNNGHSPSVSNTNGDLPLGYFINSFGRKDKEVIRLFIEKGADLETENKSGETLLFEAIEDNDLDMIKLLVLKGANINVEDRRGYRPSLSSSKKAQIIEYLVSNGANIDALDDRHDSYICEAVELGNIPLARFLVEKGIDVNQNCYFDNPPLIKAIKKDDLQFVKFLVENKANVNAIGYFNRSVMEYAEEQNNLAILDYLKSPNKTNTTSETNVPDLNTRIEGLLETNDLANVIKELKNNADKPLDEDLTKKVAFRATENANIELLNHLLTKRKFGIDSPVNFNNQTILIVASMNNHVNVVNYALAKGADKKHMDYFNKDAQNYTTDNEIKKLVRY